jgi:hypothetical protein
MYREKTIILIITKLLAGGPDLSLYHEKEGFAIYINSTN